MKMAYTYPCGSERMKLQRQGNQVRRANGGASVYGILVRRADNQTAIQTSAATPA